MDQAEPNNKTELDQLVDTPAAPTAHQLTKESCRLLPCSLDNIVSILRKAFHQLDSVDGQDLIVAYGNTGSGKSTIFTSLVYGPEALTLKTIEMESKVPIQNGQTKMVMKKERVIDQKIQREVFQIGHSSHQSKTFIPHFIKDDATGIIYADIAGMKDSDGDLIEFVNCFINKSVFKRAKSLRFLIPITLNQLKENRGMGVREQIRNLKDICSSNLIEMIDSVLPLLTKCKPNDEDLDIDERRINLQEQFKAEILAEMNNLKDTESKEQPAAAQQIPISIDEDLDIEIFETDFEEISLQDMYQQSNTLDDQDKMAKHFQEQQQFFDEFANKLEIYDPLDRTITDFEEMSIKRTDLLDLIQTQLKEINGDNLRLPLNNFQYQKLEELFETEENKIKSMAQQMIQQMQNNKQGNPTGIVFDQHPTVINYLESLKFFADYDLLEYAGERFEWFNIYVKNTMIQLTKLEQNNQRRIEEQGLQQILYSVMDSFIKRNSINYRDIANMVLKLQQQVEKLMVYPPYQNPESQQNWEYLIDFSIQQIGTIVNEVSQSPKHFLKFAYYLRILDQENLYTRKILEGKVQPSILLDIIESSVYNPISKQLEPDPTKHFKLSIGVSNYFYVQNPNSSNMKPYVAKKDALNKGSNSNEVQFLLTPNGFQICQFDPDSQLVYRLVSQDGQVAMGKSQQLRWATKDYRTWDDVNASTWQLIEYKQKQQQQQVQAQPSDGVGVSDSSGAAGNNDSGADAQNNRFYIQMPYGEIKARMIANSANPFWFCRCSASSENCSDYANVDQSVWTIEMA